MIILQYFIVILCAGSEICCQCVRCDEIVTTRNVMSVVTYLQTLRTFLASLLRLFLQRDGQPDEIIVPQTLKFLLQFIKLLLGLKVYKICTQEIHDKFTCGSEDFISLVKGFMRYFDFDFNVFSKKNLAHLVMMTVDFKRVILNFQTYA